MPPLLTIAACLITALIARYLTARHWQQWLKSRESFRLHVEPTPSIPSRALVALCSPCKPEDDEKSAAYEAALHHRETLRYLYLITSPGGMETARRIGERVRQWRPATDPIHVFPPAELYDMNAIDVIKAKVEAVCEELLKVSRLPEGELVCDFTGMFKTVSVGMVLACVPPGRRLSYLAGQYTPEGQLIRTAKPTATEIKIGE